MNSLQAAVEAYDSIKALLETYLVDKGYQLLKEEYQPNFFGSRYFVLSNNEHAVRFILDAREREFALQMSKVVAPNLDSAWNEATRITFMEENDYQKYLTNLKSSMLDAVSVLVK